MVMKPCELQKILSREWQEQGKHKSWYPRPEARFVTGNPVHDAHLHRVLVDYGIELDIDPRFHEIKDYRIIDKKKFMWFMLRWS